ncbi:peptidoglycan DD-metalloendopeptidase family protein [Actinoplanes sp. Pm04-4]|uniref:Peptidoglycan DD-metalloendopeptidase family protein n=1 Tax=Paractinoplanes pyxinae TaxID=2997416 RepID=A0ABT4B522_9ACTN|nr:peptidoglycan DD-metalloendopeptidase family protein [Actinoplanes pyxinae]MCY1140980.1 peptidoglycan DD-metalloendopeptidase family protein [Actinoplanes pyxinae]
MSRTWLRLAPIAVLAPGVLAGATPSPAAPTDPPDGSQYPRPAFALPFSCGETWRLETRDNHNPEAKKIDFYHVRGYTSGGPVLASAAGVVTELTPGLGGVEIAHGNRWYTLSLHMNAIQVGLGQRVGRGEVIGYVGNVGVDGLRQKHHLHYEQAFGRDDTGTVDFDSDANGHLSGDRQFPVLQGVEYRLDAAQKPEVTSVNGCPGGGAPGNLTEMGKMATVTQLQMFVRRAGDNALVQLWKQGSWSSTTLPDTRLAGPPVVTAFRDGISVMSREHDNRVSEWRYTVLGGWRKTYLKGKLSSSPDAIYRPQENRLYVVGRGTDNRLWNWRSAGNGVWSDPQLIDAPTAIAGTPTVALHNRLLHVVARTADNRMWEWWRDGTGKWARRDLAPARTNADPQALPFREELWTFVRGTDGHLWRLRATGGAPKGVASKWESPTLIDGSVVVGSAPAAVVYRGQMHVVVRAPDNAIHHWWGDKSTLRHEKLRGAFTADPSISVFGDQLHIAGRGTDNKLYTVWYDGKAWRTTAHGVSLPG